MINLATFLDNNYVYYSLIGILIIFVLIGIHLMSKIPLARKGNLLSGVSLLLAVMLSLIRNDILKIWVLYIYLGVGILLGVYLAIKTRSIHTPQLVAFLNGLGGLSSTIVGVFALLTSEGSKFAEISGLLAIIIGMITFVGSLIAALKLMRLITQKPVKVPFYSFYLIFLIILLLANFTFIFIGDNLLIPIIIALLLSTCFGLLFSLAVGGADMPILISLLNSFSGVAGAISGIAIADILLVAIAGIVGASGLLLTQIMSKAMNRKLLPILLGETTVKSKQQNNLVHEVPVSQNQDYISVFKNAKKVIIVPGYGLAVAQAQKEVKQLADLLLTNKVDLSFAIHLVAGRMPGHMNVLLAEADIDYDLMKEMDDINPEFSRTDLVIVIGANDTLNPSAKNEPDTPIYGMPILEVEQAKNIFFFNYDLNPGYSGVNNPLYASKKAHFFLGNAKDTLAKFINEISK